MSVFGREQDNGPAAYQPPMYAGSGPGKGGKGNNNNNNVVLGEVLPPPTCSLTNQQLQEHLQQSNFGANRGHYLCYFHEGMPPRCVTCNQPIGAHKSAAERAPPPAGRPHPRRTHFNISRVEAISNQPISSDDSDSDVGVSLAAESAACTLCNERNLAQDKHGELECKLQEIWYGFNKDVSSDEYHGVTKCCGQCWETDPVVPPSCEECGITAPLTHPLMDEAEKAQVNRWWSHQHKNIKFLRCNNNTYTSCYTKGGGKHSPGYPVKFECNRTVCSECVAKKYHLQDNSRFHHRDPEWKATLFGCFSSPRLCMSGCTCYYCCDHNLSMWEGNLDTFDATHLTKKVNIVSQQNCCHAWLCPLGAPCMITCMTCPTDLFCCSIAQVRRHEREVQARFGITPHTTAELVFCRQCAYVRLLREAEARGYPQPTCCTKREDVPGMIAQYPPHPIGGGRGVNAPASSSLL